MFVWKCFDLKGEKKDLRLIIDVNVYFLNVFFLFLTPPVGPTADVTVNNVLVFSLVLLVLF